MGDADACMALVLANTQSELHPLEEGLHALGSGWTVEVVLLLWEAKDPQLRRCRLIY